MKIFEDLIGNENIKETLGTAISNGSFSHAYIIEGEEGTGKKTIARLAAAGIICKNKEAIPCKNCDSCRKILSDNCADVTFMAIEKVDEARELKEKIYRSATEYDYKIFILTDAQKMNVKAQNALLISLEEPPRNVVFFILTTNADALLETIRSRTQILRTKRLDNETIFNYIKEKKRDIQIPDEKLREIVISSSGSLGRALNLTNDKKADEILAMRETTLKFVTSALKDDADSITYFLSLSSLSRDELKNVISSSVIAIGDLILLKKDKNAPLYFFTSSGDAYELFSKYNLQKLLAVYDSFLKAQDELASNSATYLTLMSILSNSEKKGK